MEHRGRFGAFVAARLQQAGREAEGPAIPGTWQFAAEFSVLVFRCQRGVFAGFFVTCGSLVHFLLKALAWRPYRCFCLVGHEDDQRLGRVYPHLTLRPLGVLRAGLFRLRVGLSKLLSAKHFVLLCTVTP